MNGRHTFETASPTERIASVAKSTITEIARNFPGREADYADFRDALDPYVKRELLLARISEARICSAAALTVRIKELAAELAEAEKLIPASARF